MFSLKRQQGAEFEYQARLFLESQGLRFIAANQSFACGEIDLIMQDGTTVVFVEVRRRNSSRFGSAVESINRSKQQKWIRAASAWLAQQGASLSETDCRFDVVAFEGREQQLQWLQNFIEFNY